MNISNKRIYLFGRGWLACNILSQLLKYTRKITVISETHRSFEPDVCEMARKRGLEVYKDEMPDLSGDVDICLSVYFSQKIPAKYYKGASIGSFNIHPSLLPDYKGCSSLTWAMANGEQKTGISFHELTDNFDEGAVYHQVEIEIYDFEYQLNLYHRAMYVAASEFKTAIENLLAKKSCLISGPEGRYYPRGVPNEGVIETSWDEQKKSNYYMALIHPPFPPPRFK